MKIDSIIPVAYAMNSSPKRYALLLGAGISIAADYPSGKEVAAKIILEIAKAKGKQGDIEGDKNTMNVSNGLRQNMMRLLHSTKY